jgi:hypothetical protein
MFTGFLKRQKEKFRIKLIWRVVREVEGATLEILCAYRYEVLRKPCVYAGLRAIDN